MADLKISQLTAGNPAQTNDEIPIARSGANFKITAGSISALPPTTAGANQVIYVDAAGTSLDGDPNFVYTATGNVGINTASPGARLQVSQNPGTAIGILQTGASTSTSITFDAASLGLQNTNTTNNNYNTVAFINDQGTYSVGLHGIYTSHTAGAQSGAFAIATRNAGTYAERMRIDSAGYVGIGTSTPSSYAVSSDRTLVVAGSSFASLTLVCGGSFNGAGLTVDSSTRLLIKNAGATYGTIDASGNFTITPGTGAGLAVTQTGFNLFGGTSVSDVGVPGVVTIGANSNNISSGEVVGRVQFYSNDASTNLRGVVGKIDCLATGNFTAGTAPSALTFHTNTGAAGSLAEAMRLDSSGNLGLGVTPSAWAAGNKVAQVGTFSAIWDTGTNTIVANNNFNDGANKFIGTGFAGRYSIASATGNHLWQVSTASGTAGGAVTFTSAMTLDANSRLLVGTTTNTNTSQLVAGGTISETVSSVQYLVASQFDVGTAPNQIPLNQYLGTMAFQDSTAISIGSQVVVGTATPDATIPVNAEISGNGFRYISMSNPNTGNSAVAVVRAIAGTGGETRVLAYGASHSTLANAGGLINYNATGALLLGTNGAERARITSAGELIVGGTTVGAAVITSQATATRSGGLGIRNSAGTSAGGIYTNAAGSGGGSTDITVDAAGFLAFNTNTAERARITSAGNVVIGTAALATTATDGFLYIPGCAGTPTGVPTALTGRVPLVVDTTNNKLYFYSGGAWRDAGP